MEPEQRKEVSVRGDLAGEDPGSPLPPEADPRRH